jgi:hypothetical protein
LAPRVADNAGAFRRRDVEDHDRLINQGRCLDQPGEGLTF